MKITVKKTVDRASKEGREIYQATRSDNDFVAGQTYLVRDDAGQMLVDKGFAEEVKAK
jgi:hypothetical protein